MTKDSSPQIISDNPEDLLSTEQGVVLPLPDLDTTNEFLLSAYAGGSTIAPAFHPKFSTRQQAYRFAAWLETMAETLPEEPGKATYDQVRAAIRWT